MFAYGYETTESCVCMACNNNHFYSLKERLVQRQLSTNTLSWQYRLFSMVQSIVFFSILQQ